MVPGRDLCSLYCNDAVPAAANFTLGWVSAPNERGTIDIVWNCVSTLFVSVYAMIHLNVPAKEDGFWAVFWRKALWMFVAITAPELLMLFAASQWDSAQQNIKDMRSLGHQDWSLTHAFYADSGCFMAQPLASFVFPITAKHLHFLVQNKYASLPDITKEEIMDKSKADIFAKTIAAIQSMWFVFQTIARVAYRLPLTLLEFSTLAVVVATIPGFFFWKDKPLSVCTPSIVHLNTSTATILISGGEAAKNPFRDTPLDFTEDDMSAWNVCGIPLLKEKTRGSRPLTRLPNDRDTRLRSFKLHAALTIITILYNALHLAGWRTSLLTAADQILWRCGCVVMTSVIGVYGIAEVVGAVHEDYSTTGLTSMKGYKLVWPHKLLFLVPGVIYFCARVCMIGEIVASLRSLPPESFATPNGPSLVPHI